MSKSRIELIREHELKQEATRLASEAIDMASGPKASKVVQRDVYLATSFSKLDGLPIGALICKMPPEIARRFAARGLHEPISLRMLASKWWLAYVDAAAENPNFECGGAMVKVITSSEELMYRYSGYYSEVVAGPFDRKEDVK